MTVSQQFAENGVGWPFEVRLKRFIRDRNRRLFQTLYFARLQLRISKPEIISIITS